MKRLTLMLAMIAVLASCKKDDEEKAPLTVTNSLTLNYGQTGHMDATQQCTYKSLDTIVATVNASGLVTAHRIGETQIMATSTETGETGDCLVVVSARSNLYKAPYAIKGETAHNIKSLETRELLNEYNGNLLYAGENSDVRNVMYMFEWTGLESMIVLLKESVALEAGQYLEERFTYLGEIDYKAYAYGDGELIMVLNTDATLGLNVVYFWSDGKGLANYKNHLL